MMSSKGDNHIDDREYSTDTLESPGRQNTHLSKSLLDWPLGSLSLNLLGIDAQYSCSF